MTEQTQGPLAVLWDMDGTLVDTEPYWVEAEERLVRSYGGTWTEEQGQALIGNDLHVSARALQEQGPVPLSVEDIIERLIDHVIDRVGAHVPFRPGARELLAEAAARGVPCALVTMSFRRLAEAVVGALPPGTFATLVTGDEVQHGKPHPEPYLTAAARLGVAPQDCVAIEDSVTGVTSAVAAGVPTLAVEHILPVPAGPGRRVVTTLRGWTVDDLARFRGTVDVVSAAP